jgi:hypothetical protein
LNQTYAVTHSASVPETTLHEMTLSVWFRSGFLERSFSAMDNEIHVETVVSSAAKYIR